MSPNRAISLRELVFVRDVLVPRAWVQGVEVDELLRLRSKIDGIFAALREEQAAQPEAAAVEQPSEPQAQAPAQTPGRKKKPRHPKKRRGQPPPVPDES